MKHISKSKTIKTFLFGFLLLASAAINAQTNYYVRDKAHGGNDGYNGLSPDQAWQTVDAVNNHMSSFHPGDIINFERGSYFFGTLKIKASGGENRHITFRSYGTGDKPVFIDAVTIVPNNPDLNSSWNPLQNNVWTYTDNVMKAHKVDIANLVLVRGTDTSFGEKVMSADPSMLTRQGQFLYDYDKNQLELYSESKPSEFYSSIQTVLNENAIEFNKNSYLTFDNLAFKYYGRCVVEISGNNCNFSNLDISYIGGGDHCDPGGPRENRYQERYGNGLQIWNDEDNLSSHDISITGCRVDNVYDAGISPQGIIPYPLSASIYNIYIRNNIITNCEMSFEFFERGKGVVDQPRQYNNNISIQEVYFEHNMCLNAGGAWSHNQRFATVYAPNYERTQGTHVKLEAFDGTKSNIFIRDNTFYGATDKLYWVVYNDDYDIGNIVSDENIFGKIDGENTGGISDKGVPKAPIPVLSLEDWQNTTHKELHSHTDIDRWLQISDYAGGPRYGAAAFSIGEKAYVGTGTVGSQYMDDFWQYDPATNVWTQKAKYEGDPRQGGVGFRIKDRGYIGLGYSPSGYKTDIWQYDPTANKWKRMAYFPGPGRDNAVAFTIGDSGYVGTGNAWSDFFKFDPYGGDDGLGTWTTLADFGGEGTAGAAGFSIGNKGYIGTGKVGTGKDNERQVLKDEFFEYNPATNAWTQKASFGGGIRKYARGFSIGNKGYISTGQTNDENGNQPTNWENDLWEYDPTSNLWTRRADFGGAARTRAVCFTIGNSGYIGLGAFQGADFWRYTQDDPNTWAKVANYGIGTANNQDIKVIGAASFTIDNKGYVGTGIASDYKIDFWEYDPATNVWTEKEKFGGKGRQGAVGFSIAGKGYIGTGFGVIDDGPPIKTGYLNDFWQYDPGSNKWMQIKPFPGKGRDNAVAFTISNKAYVGTGNGNRDFYEYDPSADNGKGAWTPLPDYRGGNTAAAAGFSIANKGYIGTGLDGATHHFKKDFWAYDPCDSTWTQKADFGGVGRRYARGFNIGGKGYIALGEDNSGKYLNDVWDYDPAANLWTQEANFGGGGRIRAASFSIGNSAYIGAGPGASDFWKYTPGTPNTWLPVADFGVKPRMGAAGFSIGNKGYVGTGFTDVYMRDFWEYDPSTNVWTQKEDFGAEARQGAVGFTVGGQGYLGTGYSKSGYKTDFWKFDPTANQWMQIAGFIGSGRDNAVAFGIGNKGYVGTGNGKSDFFEYDPVSNTWTTKTYFRGGSRAGAAGFSIGNKGYIGTGIDGATKEYKNDFWEYDPSTNTWTRKADFGGVARRYAEGFSIGSKGYIATGVDNNGADKNDVWEYDPYANTWTQRANFGGQGRKWATSFSIGNAAYLGTGSVGVRAGSTGNTELGARDFWKYIPLSGNIIATHVASTELHPGSAVEVKFEAYGIYSEMSSFTALLSDPVGDFTNSVIIGTVDGTSSCNIINGSVPANTSPGNRYRIRVISKNPDATGSDNGKDMTIINEVAVNIAKGIYNQNLLECKIKPNPSSQYFDMYITSASNEKLEVDVYDITGRSLLKMVAVKDQTLRFGNNLRPGVYVVEVIQGQQKKTIKVIKQ